MVSVREVIVVEGRYDKNTLSQVVDATIVETGGFGVFKDKERLSLIRRMAQKRGIIVFTDPDGAGFVIRNFLKGSVKGGRVLHAYIPDVEGKEKRKSSPSREGKLGVEGMSPEVILEALRRCGATMDDCARHSRGEITTADFYALGLSGGADSAEKRNKLLRSLALPEKMSAKALLQAVNVLMTREELVQALEKADANGGDGEKPGGGLCQTQDDM
ncbi:MAG: toprim domain-containing protein [Candidatus Heteroscillospira sp.]|jgi:ribonuclease M5